MRIGIIGFRNWFHRSQKAPKRTEILRKWIAVELEISKTLNNKVEAMTGLHLGLDFELAKACFQQDIPLHIILSCRDQNRFWRREERQEFGRVLVASTSREFASDNPYLPGCINIQQRNITEWLLEKESTLLLIRGGNFSKLQREQIKKIRNRNVIKTFKW